MSEKENFFTFVRYPTLENYINCDSFTCKNEVEFMASYHFIGSDNITRLGEDRYYCKEHLISMKDMFEKSRQPIKQEIDLMPQELPLGFYRHYKGGLYYVLEVGTHTETEEQLVIYVGKDNKIWIRPLAMWNQTVKIKGDIIPRFRKIEQ